MLAPLLPPVIAAFPAQAWEPAPIGAGIEEAAAVVSPVPGLLAAVDPEDEEEIADDELPLAAPGEEESNFDDFDDEFDDDFEEEENDPDWDHPDEGEPEPPPAKGPGGKK